MHCLVLIIACIAIVLVFICKYYGLSIIYPTLVIILAVVLDVLSNTISSRKNKRENNSLKKDDPDDPII